MNDASSVTIRPFDQHDLDGIVSVHQQNFPDSFLTRLGAYFLKLYYSEYIDTPGNYGLVAVCDGISVGSLVGTAHPRTTYSQFYKKNWYLLAPTIGIRMLIDGKLRNDVMNRIPHVRLAISSLLSRSDPKPPPVPINSQSTNRKSVPARLLSIGLLPEYRGREIASQLVEHYCAQLKNDGIDKVGLSVESTNLRAIAFYNKSGWQQEAELDGSVQYVRSTDYLT
jgi:ribosomal protein S18 acetylase RimI-like enzyme